MKQEKLILLFLLCLLSDTLCAKVQTNYAGRVSISTGIGSICKVITQALNGRTMMIVVGKQLEYLIPSVFLILCRKTFIQAMAGTGSLLN